MQDKAKYTDKDKDKGKDNGTEKGRDRDMTIQGQARQIQTRGTFNGSVCVCLNVLFEQQQNIFNCHGTTRHDIMSRKDKIRQDKTTQQKRKQTR
jgi:hypothetical protein